MSNKQCYRNLGDIVLRGRDNNSFHCCWLALPGSCLLGGSVAVLTSSFSPYPLSTHSYRTVDLFDLTLRTASSSRREYRSQSLGIQDSASLVVNLFCFLPSVVVIRRALYGVVIRISHLTFFSWLERFFLARFHAAPPCFESLHPSVILTRIFSTTYKAVLYRTPYTISLIHIH